MVICSMANYFRFNPLLSDGFEIDAGSSSADAAGDAHLNLTGW